MPLVLSLKAGQDFFIGVDRIVVGTVHGKSSFDLLVERTGAVHAITEDEAVEVLQDVYVSSGPRPLAGIAKVAIDAPQAITILRGDKYREGAR